MIAKSQGRGDPERGTKKFHFSSKSYIDGGKGWILDTDPITDQMGHYETQLSIDTHIDC
ncbi:hypothetical protein FRC16_011230, partial [Serendipita sp. 398]